MATTAPPKANAAQSTQKSIKGLTAFLNQHQAKLKEEGKIQFVDEYEIEFALDEMANATMRNTGLNIGATAMNKPGTAADQKLGSKQSMDPNTRPESAVAGQQIVQFIDQVMRRSSYIQDQQILVYNEKTGESKSTGINIKNTAWYKIGFTATAKLDQYDEIRNDYAYKIKYTISPYKISMLNSPYFKQPVFNGVHKQYRYWFTGENTQVISYEENLNALYYIAMTGGIIVGNATSSGNQLTATNNYNVNELLKYQPQTASGQSDQGADSRVMEPAAAAADQMYSPSDLKEANLTIVGDPAWLQQGEAFLGLPKGDPYYFRAFLPDGTINFDSQQILFEISYNAPADYNLNNGLIEPGRGPNFNPNTTNNPTYGTTQESRIYIVKEVRSYFSKGKFTQNLKGTLMLYYPTGVPGGRKPPEKFATQADVRRVDNAISAAQLGAAAKRPPTFAETLKSSVTNPTPTSSLAKGTQQILQPATQLDNPTLSQLQSSPTYIQARRNGATPQAALDAARAAYAAGTNNYLGAALPGIRAPGQLIVKDQ